MSDADADADADAEGDGVIDLPHPTQSDPLCQVTPVLATRRHKKFVRVTKE